MVGFGFDESDFRFEGAEQGGANAIDNRFPLPPGFTKGMLAEISSKVSNINTNITNMEAHAGTDRQARIEMTVEIRDVKHLDKVIKSIKGVEGVLGVERSARA